MVQQQMFELWEKPGRHSEQSLGTVWLKVSVSGEKSDDGDFCAVVEMTCLVYKYSVKPQVVCNSIEGTFTLVTPHNTQI